MSRNVPVHVRRKNGELTVWVLNRDVPVTDLKSHWCGPNPHFSEPLRDTPDSILDLLVDGY